MRVPNISELSLLAAKGLTEGELHAQLTQCSQRLTKTGKPYLDIQLSDSTGTIELKVWQDKPWFTLFESLPVKTALSVSGEWLKGEYGMEVSQLSARELDQDETASLFAGGEQPARHMEDWRCIKQICQGISDPRMRGLCLLFLEKFGSRFQRAAAARTFHHARRGGLLEHVAAMLRAGDALAQAYPELNRSLLLTGILFHDCGKLWETCYSEQDFTLPYSEAGELLGHIPLGIELVNKLWNDLMRSEEASTWLTLYPVNAEVRLHILHMIASHHGELAFGSPVVPKTPEAIALHYIDNLDAKLEMFRSTYAKEDLLSDHIYRRNPPLPAHIFSPLPSYPPMDTSLPAETSAK